MLFKYCNCDHSVKLIYLKCKHFKNQTEGKVITLDTNRKCYDVIHSDTKFLIYH